MDALLIAALNRRRTQLPATATCFRWIDFEIPGVTVDYFGFDGGAVGVLSVYEERPQETLRTLATALAKTGDLAAVYLKRRLKKASDGSAPILPIAGEPCESIQTTEAGLAFEIRPAQGLASGLYLDSRDARGWVRRHAAGRRVLNLFAYTCGFGVAARIGDAATVTNVDLSAASLAWGQANYAANGLAVEKAEFAKAEAFTVLKHCAKRGERFDLIVVDPPPFATSKRGYFSTAADYPRLARAAAALLAPQGILLAMCNVESLAPERFAALVKQGVGNEAISRHTFGASRIDFPNSRNLKCVVFEARRAATRPSPSSRAT